MGTVMPSKPQRNDTRQARWDRLKRASLFEQYGELQDQGLSQRRAALCVLKIRISCISSHSIKHDHL